MSLKRPGLLLGLCLAGLLAGCATFGLVTGTGLDQAWQQMGDGGPQAALAQGDLPEAYRSERIRHHVDNAQDACQGVASAGARTAQQAEIAELFEILRKSALARTLLRHASHGNAVVCLDDDTALLAYYFSGLRLIALRANLSQAERVVYLSHELAHVPQHPVYSDNRYFPPQDLVLLRRVREAAAEATATRIAWQLAEAGYEEAWRAKRRGVYGDLATAFQETIGVRRGELAELEASRAAFDQWFAESWRLDTYDRMTIDHLSRLAEDEIGLVSPRLHLSHGFLTGIGRHGERNFLTETTGRRLTDRAYGGSLSSENGDLLQSLLSAPKDSILSLGFWS